MAITLLNKLPKTQQFIFGIVSVGLVSGICYWLSPLVGYKVVALILLCLVSVIAMFFDIKPVLLACLLSALIWDYFFIPPKFTFYVSETEDVLLLFSYFFIAMINAVLNYKNRQWEKIARKREEKITMLKLYNSLFNSLSHELRTPISTIIGSTDNLKTDKDKLSEQDKDELIASISKAALRLNGNVENLLNMSRLESGVVKPIKDWCDISELVYEVKKQLKEYSSNHNIVVKIQEGFPLFNLDYGLLSQSIYNILYNAVIYTPAKSTIHIFAIKQSGNLKLTISDNGPGFPENEIENVFDKFYRINTSKTGGTGLGLSIVKGFIEAMHGTITLQNNKEGGAKFVITIPAETSMKVAQE